MEYIVRKTRVYCKGCVSEMPLEDEAVERVHRCLGCGTSVDFSSDGPTIVIHPRVKNETLRD